MDGSTTVGRGRAGHDTGRGRVAGVWDVVDRHMRGGTRMRLILVTFVVGLAVNFTWEMAQSFLYEPMGTVWAATRRCFVASPADAAILLGLLGVGLRAYRHAGRRLGSASVVGLGIVLAMAIEWLALDAGRWAYNERMPLIYGLHIGIVPVLQLALLPLVVLHVAALAVRRTRLTK
jgi:hypothetical protein